MNDSQVTPAAKLCLEAVKEIYPMTWYARSVSLLAYPMVVYARSISVLVYPMAVHVNYWHTQLPCTQGSEPYVPNGCAP